MNAQLVPKEPKRKRQPTAACMREQLAMAADEIIRLRENTYEAFAILSGERDHELFPQRTPWWRRIFRKS